jgi:hypothetical protein
MELNGGLNAKKRVIFGRPRDVGDVLFVSDFGFTEFRWMVKSRIEVRVDL